MTKFISEQSFWELFPDAKLGVLVVKGLDNTKESSPEIVENLVKANIDAANYVMLDPISANPVVGVWREAFKKFKTKKKVRSSIEALLKRAQSGNPVSSISPLVDIYNTASLKYALPCGAEDIDKFVGNLKLGITEGGDEFFALGDERVSETLEGELCYRDDKGAVCRCFNWRDCKRTMITEDTKNSFIIMESVDPSRHEDLVEAINFLEESIKKHLGGETTKYFLDKDNNEAKF